MLGTSTQGVMFDLEGNNIKGNANKGVNLESCVVGIRNPRDNGGYDSDYITVVATGYMHRKLRSQLLYSLNRSRES